MVSLKRFVAVSEKAVQVEEAPPPQTESEKILYKVPCRLNETSLNIAKSELVGFVLGN